MPLFVTSLQGCILIFRILCGEVNRIQMDLFLTIDVETYTGDYEMDIYGHGKGLTYLLNILGHFEISATFFIEALGATRWGGTKLKEMCALIMELGHDVQLHVHPKVALIDGVKIKNDRLSSHNKETQKILMETGLEILDDCGVKNVIAFRSGDLAANEDTLSVMEILGLFLSSNRDLDKKSSIATDINEYFPIRNDLSQMGRMFDLPVTSFRSSLPFFDGLYRHFEICALGTLEMEDMLSRMVGAGYSCATILTHPGEYFRRNNNDTVFVSKNCKRLERLLTSAKHVND